ncbi:MAG TPA: hypothetical protein VFB90_08265 [Dehalococcoidia bacterium]|nr:hypothetical protein [Dehalococcoidia bacterium]
MASDNPTPLYFSKEELTALYNLVSQRLGELREQIYHSDTAQFHDQLEASRRILEDLLSTLGSAAAGDDEETLP